MNRGIDSVPTDKVEMDRRVEHADGSRLGRIRKIFRKAAGDIMQGDIEGLREDLSKLQDELLDFFGTSPTEEAVDERLVKAEVTAFNSKEGIKLATKKVGSLTGEIDEMKERIKKLEAAKRCVLTGLLSKRFFLEKMSERIGMLKREVHHKTVPVSAVFFDIDDFKNVNTTYGHDPADEVIGGIGKVVREKFQREGDVTGKFGGDEFVMLLPNCDHENAMRLLEELRAEIEALKFIAFENGETEKFNATVSIGVFTAEIHKLNGKYDVVDVVKVFMKGSDEQLYKSKKNGKNCVTGTTVDMETMGVLLKKEEEERLIREAEKAAEAEKS